MWAVRNFERFFDRHPEHAGIKEEVMTKVRQAAGKEKLVVGQTAEDVFDKVVGAQFSKDVLEGEDPEQYNILMENMRTGKINEE